MGPSSGVSFARLIFADCRDTDSHSLDDDAKIKQEIPQFSAEPIPLPELEECVLLSKAYFDTVQLLYPFLHRPSFESCLAAVLHLRSNGTVGNLPPGFNLTTAEFHIFLVFSIGAALIPARADASDGYYATAMQRIDSIRLTGSLQGAQSALLLAMRSLYASTGNNLWYLNAIIMAISADLGLQRKSTDQPGEEGKSALKRRIFWCAYSLDRNLGVMLGRPFCIRDEELDVDLPSDSENDDELVVQSLQPPANMSYSSGAIRPNFVGAIFLFKMTRLVSAIRSTLYTVSDPPAGVHQYPEDIIHWQRIQYQNLVNLRDEARGALNSIRHSSRPSPAHSSAPVFSSHTIDLKYHEAIQLLFRPCRRLPQVSPFALQQCFTSGIESVRIFMKLRRQNELPITRFTAHSVFMFGITMLWAYSSSREVQNTTTSEVLAEDVRSCSAILAELERRFAEVRKSRGRFDALAQHTLANSSVSASSRMLSPHDTARRLSIGGGGSPGIPIVSPRTFIDPGVQHHTPQHSPHSPQPSHTPQPTQQQAHSNSLDIRTVQWGGFSPHDLGVPSPSSHAHPHQSQPQQGMDMRWMMDGVDWNEMQLGAAAAAVQGMVPGGMEMEGLEEGLVDHDTAMWGMEQEGGQQGHQGRGR